MEIKETPKTTSGCDGTASIASVGTSLWFNGDVSHKGMHDLRVKLNECLRDLRIQVATWNIPLPAHINLFISSYGGALHAGLGMIDTIRNFPVPIHTHVEGAAASAATLMSVAGAHRTCTTNSLMLVHQFSSGAWGKYEKLKDDIKNWELFAKICNWRRKFLS